MGVEAKDARAWKHLGCAFRSLEFRAFVLVLDFGFYLADEKENATPFSVAFNATNLRQSIFGST